MVPIYNTYRDMAQIAVICNICCGYVLFNIGLVFLALWTELLVTSLSCFNINKRIYFRMTQGPTIFSHYYTFGEMLVPKNICTLAEV